jgi:hypothetical protein
MLRLGRSRISAAAIALVGGTILVPGALATACAPSHTASPTATSRIGSVKWFGKIGPVPQARTATSPALALIEFPGMKTSDTVLFWAGPPVDNSGDLISYEFATSLSQNKWSPRATVDREITTSRPSAAPYHSPSAQGLIVAWSKGEEILYSIGAAEQGRVVSWGPSFAVPGARSTDGPTIYSPLYSPKILVTWRPAGSSVIDFDIGSPGKGTGKIMWGPIGTLPKAAAASTPSVAEASMVHAGGSITGRLFIFWRAAKGAGRIDYSTTTETTAHPLPSTPHWSTPVAFPANLRTGAAPVAQAIGPAIDPGTVPGSGYPLLVVYKAPRSSQLLYVTMARDRALSKQRTVPHISSPYSPALFGFVLAATDPGRVFLLLSRLCGGC